MNNQRTYGTHLALSLGAALGLSAMGLPASLFAMEGTPPPFIK